MVEHESLSVVGSEAEAGVEVFPEPGHVCQTKQQVTLTREMSLTSHLHAHKEQVKDLFSLSTTNIQISPRPGDTPVTSIICTLK